MNAITPALIDKPGIYQMSADLYHSDPCPQNSLSSSGAHTIAFECPATYDHERNNRVNKRVFDIGTASHLMTLEPDLFDASVAIVRGFTKDGKPSAGYASQDAKDQREDAYAAGKTPLLPDEAELIQNMRRALAADPIGRNAFKNGKAEQSIFWQDAEFGCWCRTRPDWIPAHGRYLTNWKTSASANPDDVARAIFNLGYFQKSAWELDGYEAITGERPQKYCLLVQSKSPPHLVIPVWLHADDLAWGAKINRYARGVFAWCSERNEWPGYSQKPGQIAKGFEDIRMPVWAVKQLEEKDARGEFVAPQQMENAA
jgi:hypothetical protein